MSKSNGTTKVRTFQGWGFTQPTGLVEVADCAPSSTADYAAVSGGLVGWNNLFTKVVKGDKVVCKKLGSHWVMTGLA
jgi:hypothetical protein